MSDEHKRRMKRSGRREHVSSIGGPKPLGDMESELAQMPRPDQSSEEDEPEKITRVTARYHDLFRGMDERNLEGVDRSASHDEFGHILRTSLPRMFRGSEVIVKEEAGPHEVEYSSGRTEDRGDDDENVLAVERKADEIFNDGEWYVMEK